MICSCAVGDGAWCHRRQEPPAMRRPRLTENIASSAPRRRRRHVAALVAEDQRLSVVRPSAPAASVSVSSIFLSPHSLRGGPEVVDHTVGRGGGGAWRAPAPLSVATCTGTPRVGTPPASGRSSRVSSIALAPSPRPELSMRRRPVSSSVVGVCGCCMRSGRSMSMRRVLAREHFLVHDVHFQ